MGYQCMLLGYDGKLTKLDGGRLLALLAVFAQQLLPPSLHDKHVVDGNDVDVVDALGLELVVSLDVRRDLVRARGGEAVGARASAGARRPTHPDGGVAERQWSSG